MDDCKKLTSVEISGAAEATFRRSKLPTAAVAATRATARLAARGVGWTVLVGRTARARTGFGFAFETARFGAEAGRTTGRGRGFTLLAFTLAFVRCTFLTLVRFTLALRRAAVRLEDRLATPFDLGAGLPPRIRFAEPLRLPGMKILLLLGKLLMGKICNLKTQKLDFLIIP
jgi:hypothetical protein